MKPTPFSVFLSLLFVLLMSASCDSDPNGTAEIIPFESDIYFLVHDGHTGTDFPADPKTLFAMETVGMCPYSAYSIAFDTTVFHNQIRILLRGIAIPEGPVPCVAGPANGLFVRELPEGEYDLYFDYHTEEIARFRLTVIEDRYLLREVYADIVQLSDSISYRFPRNSMTLVLNGNAPSSHYDQLVEDVVQAGGLAEIQLFDEGYNPFQNWPVAHDADRYTYYFTYPSANGLDAIEALLANYSVDLPDSTYMRLWGTTWRRYSFSWRQDTFQ